VHRWTSTGDLPTSVYTAGPQRANRIPEDISNRIPNRMPEDMPENISEYIPKIY
jgi:hypothetical protein